MEKIIIASNNKHKIIEIKNILAPFHFEVISLKEAGIDLEVEETGTTFEENAYIKAKAIKELRKDYMVLADDSGLAVEALGGEPGVFSARYAGEHGNDEKNNKKLLKKLEGLNKEEKKAKFVCAIVLYISEKSVIKVKGEVEGYIIEESRGENGFGYDPIFYLPFYNKTFAELTLDEKNKISHRGKALEKLKVELQKLIEGGI